MLGDPVDFPRYTGVPEESGVSKDTGIDFSDTEIADNGLDLDMSEMLNLD